MLVLAHGDPTSIPVRSHPWTASTPGCAYHDLRARPALIRTHLEDLQPWSAFPAIETLYQLLEWLNGADSAFESNDCALQGPTPSGERSECSGRLMILLRDLPLNLEPTVCPAVADALAQRLATLDGDFVDGAIGLTAAEVRFITLPGPARRQRGQQLLISFWAWGASADLAMASLDRTLGNLSRALRRVSAELAS